jgi:VIT1/CCC1 family predicted Fe2+/Mn2+ transporter
VFWAVVWVFFGLYALPYWGGPDLLGKTTPTVFALLLIVWLSWALGRESGKWSRRALWFGIAAAAVSVVVSLGELLFG